MAIHNSLKSRKSHQHKNVLKRSERVKALKSKKKWEEGDSIYGLPKVKTTP